MDGCELHGILGRAEQHRSRFTSPLFRGEPAAWNDANDFMQDDDTGFRCACSSNQMASALQNAGARARQRTPRLHGDL